MKKTLIATVALLAVALAGNANDITKSDAKRIASQFMVQRNANASSKAKTNGSSEQITVTAINANAINGNVINGSTIGANQPIAYACNYANGGGFVLVATDDCVSPILGYSDQGNINLSDMPQNMKGWLEGVAAEIEMIKSGRGVAISRSVAAADAEVVVDSLVTTLWSQETPYNSFCPEGSPSGCGATALAQIMNYHQWPKQGTGSYSYNLEMEDSGTKVLSADFSQSVYDWDNMLPTYVNYNWNDAQGNAVAKLMYDCGVALRMTYSTKGSAAMLSDIAYGANRYFNYLVNTYCQDVCSTEKFEDVIQSELNNARPVLFSGYASENFGGGHFFVVDGYRNDGMYHVNWGWNGQLNGFYNLCLMNPSPMLGYIFPGKHAIITFTPNKDNSPEKFYLNLSMCDGINGGRDCGISIAQDFEGDKSSALKVSLKGLMSDSQRKSNSDIGLGLYDENDSLVKTVWLELEVEKQNVDIDVEAGTFSDVADGNYALRAICTVKCDGEESPIQAIDVRGPHQKLNVAIAGSTMKVSNLQLPSAEIQLAGSISMPDTLAFFTPGKYSIPLVNKADAATDVFVKLEVKTADSDTVAFSKDITNLVMYEKKEVNLEGKFFLEYEDVYEGDYLARFVLLDITGDTINVDGTEKWHPIHLYVDETKTPTLEITNVEAYEYNAETDMTDKLDVDNLVIDLSKDFQMAVVAYYKIHAEVPQTLIVGLTQIGFENASYNSNTVTFKIDNSDFPLGIGEYDLTFQYYDKQSFHIVDAEGSPNSIHLKVIDSTTGINAVENGEVGDTSAAKIYDINGRPVSSDSRGLKIIVEPKTGKAKKIIVK